MNLLQSSQISETAYPGTYSYMPEVSNLPNEGYLTHFAPTDEINETIRTENSSNAKVTMYT